MLYDPKWETKVDPLSLAGLIAWLETQPANRTYEWMDCSGGCLIGEYGRAIGIKRLDRRNYELNQIFGGDNGTIFDTYSQVCNGGGPYTYGAALKRAREVLSEANQ